MKEAIKAIGKDVYSAGRLGFFVFVTYVSVGVAWKLGSRVLDKMEDKLEKPHKD